MILIATFTCWLRMISCQISRKVWSSFISRTDITIHCDVSIDCILSIFPLAICYRSRFSLLYNVSMDLTLSLIRNFSTIPAKVFGHYGDNLAWISTTLSSIAFSCQLMFATTCSKYSNLTNSSLICLCG